MVMTEKYRIASLVIGQSLFGQLVYSMESCFLIVVQSRRPLEASCENDINDIEGPLFATLDDNVAQVVSLSNEEVKKSQKEWNVINEEHESTLDSAQQRLEKQGARRQKEKPRPR
jgi:gas vesicle protein